MSYLPYEGSSYYVDSDNFYHFNAIVPYSTYNYRVEVISPVEPTVSETTSAPLVTLQDVKKWVMSFDGIVDSHDNALYPLFILLRDIATEIIVYELCGSENLYRRAVSYYVAHHMELHIKTIKDQQSKMSLNAETKNSVDENDIIKITLVDNEFGNYKQTIWGQMFWTVYGSVSKFNIGYAIY